MRFRGCSGLSHGFDEQLDANWAIILFRYRREREASFLLERLGQKLGRSHPRFDGPERMFDDLMADRGLSGARSRRSCIASMMASCSAALLSGRALGFGRAARHFVVQ
jgi:hypothetical protein